MTKDDKNEDPSLEEVSAELEGIGLPPIMSLLEAGDKWGKEARQRQVLSMKWEDLPGFPGTQIRMVLVEGEYAGYEMTGTNKPPSVH